MNTKWMKTRLAAFLICALAAQNASFAWADTRGTADRAGRETDAAGGAAGQAAETALESGNTSFVSFPSRFSDMLPDGFEEQYYCFALEGTAVISISVESDDSSCQYGAELLDSGFASLGLSQRKSGQRMIQRDLPAGTYFLRVFPLSENTWEPYSVSLQKLKLSAEEVRKTDFSELHMVAALQGDDSPYQMNGMNPDYGFTGDGSVSPVNYQWYRLESPVYSGRGVNGGGVYPMPQSYYSAWLGPVAEDVIPISEVKGYTEGSLEDYEKYLQEEAIAYREGTPLIHVQNAIALPMKYTGYYEDGEGIENPGWEAHIKAGIMNYGALTTGIYWSYLSGDEEKNYYYSGWDYTYVSDSDGNYVKVLKNMLDEVHYQNHEVVVVGWDDEYPRENFRYRIDRDTEGVVMDGPGQEVLKIPLVTNGYMIANIPQRAGVCRLYDPEMGEWLDIGEGFVEDNGSNNYYGYFAVKAMCSDASLEDGEMERITALEIDPEVYYALLEDPGSEESPEGDVASPSDAAWDAWEMASAQESETATPSDAPAAGGAEEAEGGRILRDGHVLARRAAGMPLEMGELAEPDTVLPESFDLREEGVLTPVKDQASTNTCWSFGSTAAVESSYLLNGSNLYDFNYSSGISLETELPLTEEGRVIYRFDKNQPESLELAVFLPELLAWEDGPIEDAQGRLRWELSGDLSAVDTSDFEAETGGTGLTENGEAVCLFTPEESGILTVKVSSADDPTKTASCQVVLLEDNAVDRISVSPENLRLRAGQTHQLEVSIEAPEESQVNPIFSSDNPNIAAVDDSGLVLGVDSGTTVIRVRAGGEEAVCTVTVWKPGRSEGGDSDGGAGNSGKDRPVHGSWIQAADGSWNFSAGGSTYQNTWGYLYNPYGAAGAGEAGWFRFDAAGRLLTGWFQDEDGSWYYLNPISDGSLGKMATGWRWIPDASGREYCYYFHPNAGGPMGAMAASGKTPDGYEVDAQGRWCADGTPQTR